MKRIIALSLVLSLLFLFACKKQETEDTTTTQATQTTTLKEEKNALPEYVTEWGSDLLPADFPAPPAKTYDVSVKSIPAENTLSGICKDITRLIFTCPETEFYKFSNKLVMQGFYGGMKNIVDGTLYSDGFAGGWKSEKYIIVIIESRYEDNGDLKICLDIAENTSSFPEALKAFFPEFAFPARTGGTYIGYNTEDDQTNDFNGSFEHKYWQWHFRFDNAFTGVSMNDFNAYIDALEEAGFSGEMGSSTIDGCTVINADIVKDNFAIILSYNQILRRLDIVYTNNADDLLGAAEEG